MKKLSQKGVLLFIGAMAAYAFAMPSMAAAASWGVIGTEHTLRSPDFRFSTTVPGIGDVSSSCSSSTLTVDVVAGFRSTSALTVTSTSFTGCTATGPNIGTCTAIATATPSPNPDWSVPGATTSNIQFHGVVIDMTFLNHFRSALCLNVAGTSTTITGTLGGGQWTGNGSNQHEVVFSTDEGFVMHTLAGTVPLTVSGTFRDTQQTLTLS